MKKSSTFLLLLACFLYSTILMATHNRAGEITYEQIGSRTFRVTIHTYTKTSSVPADRDSLYLCWGDGNCEYVVRANGNGLPLPNDIKYNIYQAEHFYLEFGEYTLTMTDPNRNGGILNVNHPFSDNVAFHIETMLTVSNNQTNNSPVLLAPPVDVAFVDMPFHHTPNAFDLDGDSIAYELITPHKDVDEEVSNYLFPHEVQPGSQNTLELNESTGELIWNSPELEGEYVVAILIKEYRNGQLISSMFRDMQILVKLMQIIPPTISMVTPPTVIQSGAILDLDIEANHASNDLLLTATGGPLALDEQPAVFTAPTDFQSGSVSGNLRWETTSSHERTQPYQIVVKAEDTDRAFTLNIFQITVDQSSSNTNLSTIGQLLLFPNPVTDKVWLQWSGKALNNKTRIAIYNLQGKLVLEKEVDDLKTAQQLDLSGLPQGAYMLNVSNDAVHLSQQLIKD